MPLPRALQSELEAAESKWSEVYEPENGNAGAGDTGADDGGASQDQLVEAPPSELTVDLQMAAQSDDEVEEEDEVQAEAKRPAPAAPPAPAVDLAPILARIAAIEIGLERLANQLTGMAQLQSASVDIDFDKISLATDQDVEEYGEDLTKLNAALIRRFGKAVVPQIAAAIQNKLVPVVADTVTKAQQVVQTGQRTTLYGRLTELVPDWRAVNESSGWKAWLSERDDISGRVRNELLQDAFKAGDADRCAKFFFAYRGSNPAPNEKKPTPRVPLENLATPGAGSGASPRDLQPQPYSRMQFSKDFDAILNEKRVATRQNDHDKLKKLDAKEQALHARFAKAIAEGRVTP